MNKNLKTRLAKVEREKIELEQQIEHLTEVLEITARRHAALKAIVDEFQWANRPRQSLTIITGPRTTK
jgi:hypothetical protein